ncbi:alanine--tRNA ligase [Luteococcus sp. H138]|uniref:alanine--tRNA ligase n=1 Tax=unclassified Luteococcus TaxID=2639923 RepID=UPI00313EFECE
MKAAEIGRRYLDFFASKEHAVVPSASLLYNDPTLLFVNAGMVPFKPYFTGEEAAPWKRAVSNQKCVRTLDIEEVGKTTRHGTFFQMLGNFSFGDYFKKEAIEYAWELVTSEQHNGGFGFAPEKVWVTVLGPGFHPDYPEGDREAIEYWLQAGIPREHIQGRSLKDNYWNMGVPGPGGPCSEIYIDRGPQYGEDGGPEADEDRFLEIWNLVFQQEDLSAVRAKDDFDIARQLPTQNIDTGAGLERISYLLQGKNNMYEIDEVFPVIERAAEMAGKAYGRDPEDDIRLRVVGDHVRSSLMLMTDGVTPGNEARGYVLRRLLRRSVRSMRLLGVTDPVLPELLGVSKSLMEVSYPDVADQWDRVLPVATNEEQAFRRTLTQGTQLFDLAVADVKGSGAPKLSGDKAFQLHDTYGFPIDLTLEMASEAGLDVDVDGFKSLMAEQRNRAKADAKAKKGGTVSHEAYRELREQGETPFLGYTELSVPTTLRGIIADGHVSDRAQAGQTVELVLAETPFYAESGGQDSDAGTIVVDGVSLDVLDVQRPVPGLVVHKVQVPEGVDFGAGSEAKAIVDAQYRLGACQAHTATHVLGAALRELVGPTATQAGSYNKPGYLRFDYSSQQSMGEQMRLEIEERCQQALRENLEFHATELPLAEARAKGAQAMFGEKYPEIVRMVELGDGNWSRELCGGTHVASTAQIGMIDILSEQSIGSGARRFEALVSTDAFKHLAGERALVNGLTDILKTRPEQLTERVEKLVADLKAAEKQIADLKAKQLMAGIGDILATAHDVNGYTVVTKEVPGVGGNELRNLATELRGRLADVASVVALVGGTDDKPALIVATGQAARDKGAKAGALVRVAAEKLGGKGGGKDDMAQGGGTNGAAAPEALAALEAALQG